jgi:site-specific DNA recombinase
MVKAFAYARVSGDSQIAGDGFPRQLTAIKGYAKQHAIRIVDIFREEGVSGTRETMDRPAWTAMMTALYSNGVRTILIERLDRLARTLMAQEAAIMELQKHGITLISVQEPDLMSDDPSRKAFRQMMGVFAEYDKSQIVLKLKVARERKKAQTGRCEGRKPYGYYEGEPAILLRMRELHLAGLSFHRVATQLNAEGLNPRMGQKWHGFAVNRILAGKRLETLASTRTEQPVPSGIHR